MPTNDFINVNVDAVAKVRISPDPDGIKLAAKNFLNKKASDITTDLQDSLQGNMREIIGTLSLKEINTDRDSFSDQVMQKASRDMDKLGIEILSCNIQNVTDENGLIRDLGADNTAMIKKNASIAKAQADRDVAIAQAEADKAANDARVLADTQIAQKNTELEITRAELKITSDTKKAEADAAYTIQEQEQQKSIETARVNAQIAKAERDAELKKQEVEIAKQKLDATGCDGLMVGRAAQGNPWIFTEILHYLKSGEQLPPPSLEERIQTALKHLTLLIEYKGEHRGIQEARKHMSWYFRGMIGGAALRDRINKVCSFSEMQEVILGISCQFRQ